MPGTAACREACRGWRGRRARCHVFTAAAKTSRRWMVWAPAPAPNGLAATQVGRLECRDPACIDGTFHDRLSRACLAHTLPRARECRSRAQGDRRLVHDHIRADIRRVPLRAE